MPSRDDVTIYQVAEQARVSISTVSLAINHPHRVSPATRSRVLEVAGELGYRPGATPSERARSRTGRIVVLAPFSSYDSYRSRLMGVLGACHESGVEVIVHDAPSAAATEYPLLDALPIRGDVDGVIVMGLPLSDEGSRRLADWGPPTVVVDSAGGPFSSVQFDDEQGGYLIGRHLAELGHRRIGFLHEPQLSAEYVSAGMRRLAGLRRALADAGGGFAEQIEAAVGDSDAARAVAERVLTVDRSPTAIFANHDLLAAGFLAGARSAGVAVPEGVSVVGFDDAVFAESLDLTTVRQPFAESGRAAAELLLSLVQRPRQTARRILLTGELIVRGTTGRFGSAGG